MQLIQTTLPALVEGGYSKKELQGYATGIVDEVLDRGIPLEMAEKISATEQLIKFIKEDKRYVDYVRDELAKYKGKYSSESGTKIEAAEVGTKYDFSNCNDPELKELEIGLFQFETAVNDRKAFLKTVPISGMNIITIQGEAVTVYPPSKTSTSSFKTTLSK